MDVIFNEQSFRDLFPDIHSSRSGMQGLLNVCKKARELGLSRLAIRPDFYTQNLNDGYSISDWLNDQEIRRVFKDLLQSIVRFPYIDIGDTAIEDRYILSNTFLIGDEKVLVEGLAVAYMYNTLSASFYTSEKWNVDEIDLKYKEDGLDEQIVKVNHACKDVHVENKKEWITSMIGVKLKIIETPPKQKKINLSGDHHGRDVLMPFCRKLVRSAYVVEIVTSLPYNSHTSEMIQRCYEDGKIEIILTRTDSGYGIMVQTTGRNLTETTEISKRLEREFNDEY